MEKKYEVTITSDKNNKLRFDRANTGFNGLELLGLLEILREDIMIQMEGKKQPEIEHKCKVVLNDTAVVENRICRECMHGNFTTNICNKGYTRCDEQNCLDFKKYEEL